MSAKVISGVYISDGGTRKVMTRKEFITKLRLKGSGKGGTKTVRWHKLRVKPRVRAQNEKAA